MAGLAVALVKDLGIDAVQLPHPRGKIAVRRLNEKRVKIGPEAAGRIWLIRNGVKKRTCVSRSFNE